MKKIRFLSLAAVLVLALLMLTGCGKSTFAVTENTEKRMVITAENAAKAATRGTSVYQKPAAS